MLSALRRRLRGRSRETPEAAAAPAPQLVDALTRTYWRPGSARAETLVETPPEADATAAGGVVGPDAPSLGARVAALVNAHDRRLRPRSDADIVRAAGTGDPAFLEMLVVELLRAGRGERAFDLLAPDCQASWLAPSRFAAAHRNLAGALAGVEILEVTRLASWTDPVWERTHHDVAELEVEYRLERGDGATTLRRTVHQVRLGGRWRVLLYPPRAAPVAAP